MTKKKKKTGFKVKTGDFIIPKGYMDYVKFDNDGFTIRTAKNDSNMFWHYLFFLGGRKKKKKVK